MAHISQYGDGLVPNGEIDVERNDLNLWTQNWNNHQQTWGVLGAALNALNHYTFTEQIGSCTFEVYDGGVQVAVGDDWAPWGDGGGGGGGGGGGQLECGELECGEFEKGFSWRKRGRGSNNAVVRSWRWILKNVKRGRSLEAIDATISSHVYGL